MWTQENSIDFAIKTLVVLFHFKIQTPNIYININNAHIRFNLLLNLKCINWTKPVIKYAFNSDACHN